MMKYKLGELLEYEQPTKYIVDSTEYSDEYSIPVLTAGQSFILGYTSETHNVYEDVPVIIFDDFTTSIQYVDFPFKVKSSAMKILKNTEKVDLKFMYFLLSTIKVDTGLHKRYWISKFADMEVEVPELNMQKEIVYRLEKIAGIIKKKEKEKVLLDELVKSRFVELFGDPVTNPKGWDMPLIEEVVDNEKNALKAGPFGSTLKKEYYVTSGYKIYGQEQVISGDHAFGDYYIDEERYKMLENCAVQAGDVLISLVGTYGKLLVMPEEFEPGIINPRLMKITFDKKRVNPYYFQHYFQSDSLKKALAENTHGGTMDILNLGIVRKLAIPLPPLELQNEFLRFVKQTDKSKVAIQKSLDEMQVFYDKLMQDYFG